MDPYAECGARISRIAAALHDRVLASRRTTRQQPVIAVLLPKSHHVLEFFFAAAVTDSILIPLNHRLSPVEIEAGLRTSGAVVLLTSDAFAETLDEIDRATLPVQAVVRTGAAVELEVTDHRSWDSLLSAATSP